MIVVIGFDFSNEHSQGDAQEHCGGQLETVVGMELKFWKQIAAGDANKRAAGEGQRSADVVVVGTRETGGAKVEQNHAQRDDQGKTGVGQVTSGFGPSAFCHQCSYNHGIKRLVKKNHQESAEPGQGLNRAGVGFRLDARTQGNPIDNRVEDQA